MAILGKFQKITAQKKLMIKINADTYHRINQRCEMLAKKKNFAMWSMPTWLCQNDDTDNTHFLMVKLDEYDIQNMQKFKRLIKSDVAIDGFPTAYAFIPEGEEEQKCGINFVLTTIRAVKKKQDVLEAVADIESAKAEERIVSDRSTRMTELELLIDGDVDAQVAKNLGHSAKYSELLLGEQTEDAAELERLKHTNPRTGEPKIVLNSSRKLSGMTSMSLMLLAALHAKFPPQNARILPPTSDDQ